MTEVHSNGPSLLPLSAEQAARLETKKINNHLHKLLFATLFLQGSEERCIIKGKTPFEASLS